MFCFKKLFYCFSLFTLFCISQSTVYAGTACKDNSSDPKMWLRASQKALELKKALDKTQAQVALIARVGSDVRKYGFYYTHVAFAVKNFSKTKNQWTVFHLLNACGTASSNIHAQGLMNFFLDDLINNDFEVIVPTVEVQAKINQALHTKASKKIHSPHYNMLAYPFSTRFQNSNQWILELIAAAESDQFSRQRVQSFLHKTGYQPTVIHVDPLEKLGASLFKQHIRFDDHPQIEQRHNSFSVVTVDSIQAWLKKNHQLQSVRQYRG